MKIFHYFSSNNPFKIDYCLEELGINDLKDSEKEYVLDEISKYIFDTTKSNKNKEAIFDFEEDYRYYFCDFFKLGINLNIDDINWWEFDALLESIMLDEKSTMSQVIKYRTYEKPSKNIKAQEEQEHRYRMKMKNNYALKKNNKVSENAFERLWNYTERKAGVKKET